MSGLDQDTMTDYRSNTTLAEITGRIDAARSIVVTSHAKPDADAMGSAVVLHRALAGDARQVEVVIGGPVSQALQDLAGDTPWRLVEEGDPPRLEPDLVLVVDTGTWPQLEHVATWLRERYDRAIVIDHHAHGDEVSSHRYIDTSCAATSQILIALLDELGIDLSGGPGGIAEALFAALATDTGWFRFPNADAACHAAASILLARGVDTSRIYRMLEENSRPQRLALTAQALASLSLHFDDSVAVMSLGPDDFARSGAGVEDLTGLVNEPMAITSVRLSILLSEPSAGRTKMSFRSKAAVDGQPEVTMIDVNILARRFGGGGHIHAAGARHAGDLEEARLAVLETLGEVVVTPG